MEELTRMFEELLKNHGSVDVAEAEFKRIMSDDPELHALYRQWCEENGHTERHGFLDFAEEYIENQNSVWDSLTDEYDN